MAKKYKKKSDCDKLINGAEDTFKKLGDCFESAFDTKKSKISVAKNIFGFGASLSKLAFNATGCAIKNTPKAVVAVASVKREIVDTIEEEIRETKKQMKKEVLNNKIEHLIRKA